MTAESAICLGGYNGNDWCDAVTDDLVRDGWYIGHLDGQGYYVCPEHKDMVWDPALIEEK